MYYVLFIYLHKIIIKITYIKIINYLFVYIIIDVFDIKNMNCLNTFQAHTLAIKSLAVDEINDYLISSSIEGDIKVK